MNLPARQENVGFSEGDGKSRSRPSHRRGIGLSHSRIYAPNPAFAAAISARASAAAYRRGAPWPQTGPGQAGSPIARATTCRWNWRTRLPSAPTLILSRLHVGLEEIRRLPRLFDQHAAIGRVEIGQLDNPFAPWNENEPWPPRVVHQEQRARAACRRRRTYRSPAVRRAKSSCGPSLSMRPARQAEFERDRLGDVGEARAARRSARAWRRRRRRRSAHARGYGRSRGTSGRCRDRR